MSIDAPDFTEASATDLMEVPTSSTTEATSFFSLPLELRNLIYHYLFKDVYTQMRVNARLRNLRLDQPDGGKASPARQLEALQTSQRLFEEGSRILYGDNQFRLHIGWEDFSTTLLERRITDLMQDIEITLHLIHPSNAAKALEALRFLQLFDTPQILRRSCLVKLQLRKVELTNNNMIEALKKLTGFKVLTFEVDVPTVAGRRSPGFPGYGRPVIWVSELLAFVQLNLTPAMGNGTFANDHSFRRLIFKPHDHKKPKTGGTQVI